MASRLQDVILRGTAATRPLATAVAQGTLYYASDTQVTTRSNGTVWESFNDSSASGPPALHAPTHAAAGTDPVNVVTLGGYPGGTAAFLRADGSFAIPPGVPTARIGSIELIIDGGASAITTGLKGYLEVPFAATIQAVTLLADISGSIVVDIWKAAYAAYPPVVGNTITASAKPTITTNIKSQDTTLTGWNKAIAAGDILAFNVDSVTTTKKLTLSLKISIP